MTDVELKQAMCTGWLSVKFCRYLPDRFQGLTRDN